MFGFDKVAAFTHDFETPSTIRKCKIDANHDIVTVSLSARELHPHADRGSRFHGPYHRRAIVEERAGLIGGELPRPGPKRAGTEAQFRSRAGGGRACAAGWTIEIAFEPGILRNGTNPLALLDDLRSLGPCVVAADLALCPNWCTRPRGLPDLLAVTLESACNRDEIEDVFHVRPRLK